MQARASEDLVRLFTDGCAALLKAPPKGFYGPRRIGLTAQLKPSVTTEGKEERGPRIGAPDQAIEGFLKKHGATRDALKEEGQFWVLSKPGRTLEARALIARMKPDVVVGFGGYPTVPPVLAASMKGIPTILHEANAVMGRANRFLAKRATLIATGFPVPHPEWPEKTVFSGNPVRKPVLLAAESEYHAPESDGVLNLLVFGGSLGARVMSEVVPAAMQRISPELRARLAIVQQAREEDVNRVSRIYDALRVKHEIAPFFSDLPHRIAHAHLVIARAGAMTVTELSVIGRPAILVPFPGSIDQDQATNAAVIVAAGGALAVPQSAFTPVSLAEILERKMSNPGRLAEMAAKAKSIGIADAASRLAGHVLSVLSKRTSG
jgi:UDP-N-acetylglucosamine--N-acetylmuramyl-(pentapeptide) pyrophosphoryl-undecaprenol N-acetylglucosamine transferase